MKAGKSSTKSSSDRRLESSHNTSGQADMDSCITITDTTVLADQSTATTTTATNTAATTSTNKPLQTVSKPSVAGRGSVSDTAAPARTVASLARTTETAAESTSRLFDLVNADSPAVQVS